MDYGTITVSNINITILYLSIYIITDIYKRLFETQISSDLLIHSEVKSVLLAVAL